MRKLLSLFGVWLFTGALVMPVAAAPTGSIEGRVINGDSEEPVAGVEVTLTAGDPTGTPVTQEVTTGKNGSYSFEDLPTGTDRFYALDARYEDGLFPGRALTLPSDTTESPVIETTIRVWPTTTDPAAIVVARDDLFVVESEGGEVGVIEALQITNTSDKAYIGRGAGLETATTTTPSLGFALPAAAESEGVQVIDSSLDIPELVRTDFGFGITAAIPPGRFNLTFSYSVPGIAASHDLSRRILYPTLNFAVFSSDKLSIESNRLVEGDKVEIEGREYLEHTSETDLAEGASLQVVATGDVGTPPGLIAGMAGALVLVTLLGLIPLIRSRRDKGSRELSRSELLTEIAELDLRHERGELDEETWVRRRADLRAQLARHGADNR